MAQADDVRPGVRQAMGRNPNGQPWAASDHDPSPAIGVTPTALSDSSVNTTQFGKKCKDGHN